MFSSCCILCTSLDVQLEMFHFNIGLRVQIHKSKRTLKCMLFVFCTIKRHGTSGRHILPFKSGINTHFRFTELELPSWDITIMKNDTRHNVNKSHHWFTLLTPWEPNIRSAVADGCLVAVSLLAPVRDAPGSAPRVTPRPRPRSRSSRARPRSTPPALAAARIPRPRNLGSCCSATRGWWTCGRPWSTAHDWRTLCRTALTLAGIYPEAVYLGGQRRARVSNT